jgi:hypothetical protein
MMTYADVFIKLAPFLVALLAFVKNQGGVVWRSLTRLGLAVVPPHGTTLMASSSSSLQLAAEAG